MDNLHLLFHYEFFQASNRSFDCYEFLDLKEYNYLIRNNECFECVASRIIIVPSKNKFKEYLKLDL